MISKFYRALVLAGIRSSFANRTEFVSRATMMALNNIVFFSIWLIYYSQVDQIGGWTFPDMLLLFGFSSVSIGLSLSFTAGFMRLHEMIRNGEFQALLLRPRSTLFLTLASKSEPSSWGDIVTGLLMVFISGYMSYESLLLLPILILLGAVIFTSASIVFCSLAFWSPRSDEASFRLFESMISFSLFPEGIHSRGIRIFLYLFLPVGLLAYLPVEVLRTPSLSGVTIILIGALIWMGIASWVFQKGISRFMSS